MNSVLLLAGRLAGAGGVLLCLVAIALRLMGHYFVGGFQIGSMLQAGMAGMLAGCFFFLASMTSGSQAENR